MMKIILSLFLLVTLGACAHKKKCSDKASCAKEESCNKSEAKEAVAYGGLCANGLCKKLEVKGDEKFKVDYKGKCYLFSSAEARDNFLAKIEENIKKADAHWEKVSADRVR